MSELIVLVPGLYSPRWTMALMAYRFRQKGFQTKLVSNQFLSKTPAENAHRILTDIQQVDAQTVHLLGHSLGGIVIMHLLAHMAKDQSEEQRSAVVASDERASRSSSYHSLENGKVVLMAAPILGSALAKKLHTWWWFRPLLGKSVENGLLGDGPRDLQALNIHGKQVGLITGSKRLGVSALFFRPKGASDGVVSQNETELEGASDTVCIPQSHALMLFSRVSVDKAASFFKHGHFV